MKLKTQEKIRLAEVGAILALTSASILVQEGCLLEHFSDYEMLIRNSNSFLMGFYNCEILFNYRTQRLTDEYKEIKTLYKEVIKNTKNMIQEFEVDDPISIFAMYVFLSRKGYLSYNKRFAYDTDMKDFALLGGVDVIRGSGVCRSISSMLNDIYHESGIKSHCLGVSAKDSSFVIDKDINDIKLEKSSSAQKFVDIILPITTLLRAPNHLVTEVYDDKFNHIFDPTNNNIYYGKGLKLVNLADEKAIMHRSDFSTTLVGLVGNYDACLNPIINLKQSKLPHIDYEEYKKMYLDTIKLIKDNIDIIEDFYNENSSLYKDIVMLSNEQNDLIHRLIPFIPKGKIKTKLKGNINQS